MARQTIKHGAEIDFCTPDELRQMLTGREPGHSGLFDVVAGDFQGPEPALLTNPPVRRLRVTKPGSGADAVAVPAANPVLILPANEGRMGGQIVNYGAAAVFLYLGFVADESGSEIHMRPALWVSGNGGTWDFQISSLLWGGSVSAQAITAATTLTVVEI